MSAVLSLDYWKSKIPQLDYRNKAFINGKYVAALSGQVFETINPANGQVITKISSCQQEDINEAVKAARTVFEKGSWSNMPGSERKIKLLKFAELMEKNSSELALLETLDMGKPIRDSINVDVPLSVNCIRWYAEAIDKVYDEIAPTGPDAISMIRREPLGVIGAVVPWNFPLLMACWKIGPILATGNSMVLKPAEQSSLTVIRIAELAAEAGIPEGVFNVVPGMGETAGQALGRHMDVDCITFTGSTEVGKYFLKYSGESNMKRVSLECGGKTPNIIMADAPDLDAAATAAAWGIFFNQGEVCNAGSRLIVEDKIKDKVLQKIMEVGKTLRPGDPLDPNTCLGAMVDKTQFDRVMGYIKTGQQEGAKLVFGGNQLTIENKGYFIEPTIFDHVDNKMRIAQEEIFGPVLSTITFTNQDQAIKIANDTIYGLAAAVWTKDINKALTTSKALKAGVVWVNCFDNGHISSPFGGFKQSGFGRDKSLHAMHKYTDVKATWIQIGK
ncbi:MAG: aldehyde dehydrogenase [Alphaproteobacteria bacterium]|nr:aldehyde dehydrogenase [Alphaproteobacteria bacterium]